MAKHWPFPQDSNSDKSGFMEHRGGTSRGEFTDSRLASELEVGTNKAHDMIEGVTEQRTTDLGEWE